MSEHTPEPWHGRVKHRDQYTISQPQFGDLTAMFGPEDRKAANMRRIVACVNACAGIPTEEIERILEAGADFNALFDHAADHREADASERDRLQAEVARLTREVDALMWCECPRWRKRESKHFGDCAYPTMARASARTPEEGQS